jgi:hypothetical protein
MKALRSGRLTTTTDIIRGTHLHPTCYEDVRIALDDFFTSLYKILGYYFGAYIAKSQPFCDMNLFHVLESELCSPFSTSGAVHDMSREKNFSFFV